MPPFLNGRYKICLLIECFPPSHTLLINFISNLSMKVFVNSKCLITYTSLDVTKVSIFRLRARIVIHFKLNLAELLIVSSNILVLIFNESFKLKRMPNNLRADTFFNCLGTKPKLRTLVLSTFIASFDTKLNLLISSSKFPIQARLMKTLISSA